jgi:condensin-2 complex subunit D3
MNSAYYECLWTEDALLILSNSVPFVPLVYRKIGVTHSIASEIFAKAVQPGTDLHKACSLSPSRLDTTLRNAYNVVRDAIVILSNHSIKPRRSPRNTDDSIQSTQQEKIAHAKGEILWKLSQKHVLELMLPTLASLKEILQAGRSPLLKELMEYLVIIYRTYPDEMADHLKSQTTLLQEIQFDAKASMKNRKPSISMVDVVED